MSKAYGTSKCTTKIHCSLPKFSYVQLKQFNFSVIFDIRRAVRPTNECSFCSKKRHHPAAHIPLRRFRGTRQSTGSIESNRRSSFCSCPQTVFHTESRVLCLPALSTSVLKSSVSSFSTDQVQQVQQLNRNRKNNPKLF